MPAHILIIEDNEMSLVLAEHLLRQAGYETSTATDGSAGVRSAMENTADLILCDLDLPALDGAEVLDALRSHPHWRAVPVIAFTVAAAGENQQRKPAAGFDGSVMKPIDPKTFAAAIESYLAPQLRASHS